MYISTYLALQSFRDTGAFLMAGVWICVPDCLIWSSSPAPLLIHPIYFKLYLLYSWTICLCWIATGRPCSHSDPNSSYLIPVWSTVHLHTLLYKQIKHPSQYHCGSGSMRCFVFSMWISSSLIPVVQSFWNGSIAPSISWCLLYLPALISTNKHEITYNYHLGRGMSFLEISL